jgi:hypothetical protein
MANTYNFIASNVLSSSAASVTFSAIPATYTDLVVRWTGRVDTAAVTPSVYLQLNADTGTNYSYTALEGTGSAASSYRAATNAFIHIGRSSGSTATANTFGSGEVYIPSYTLSQNKPVGAVGMGETNATTAIMDATAGLWRNTAAITSVTVYPAASGNFVSGSSFYLYGIKNS